MKPRRPGPWVREEGQQKMAGLNGLLELFWGSSGVFWFLCFCRLPIPRNGGDLLEILAGDDLT